MLKGILLAYAKGMISSRQIERACHENILFIALSYGYAPDTSTIAAFVSSMQKEISSIFSDILTVCAELDLLGGTHFSLDGVKLSANVSKEWGGTLDKLNQLQEKLKRVMEEHAQADQHPQVEIERQKNRERRFQVQVERLNEFLKDREPKLGSTGKEIQSNTAEAFASQDHKNLKPVVEGAKKNVAAIGKDNSCFQGTQPPDAKSRLFTTADFSFDPDKQVYRCLQGKELTCHARNQVNRHRIYDL